MMRMGRTRCASRALVLAGAALLVAACAYVPNVAPFAQPAFGSSEASAPSSEPSATLDSSEASASGAHVEDGQDESGERSSCDDGAYPEGSAASCSASSSGDAADASSSSSSSSSSGKASASKSSSPKGKAAAQADDVSDLADGAYSVSVTLMQASNLSNSSMASSALNGTHGLSVEDGQYRLSLAVGTVTVGTIVGYVNQIDYYPDYTVDGTRLKTSGNAIKCWTASSTSDKGPASVPVLDNAKSLGYVPLKLYSDAMGGSQIAALKIDWSSVKAESADDSGSDGSDGADDSAVDKSKLRASIKTAAAAINKGGKTESATKALKEALVSAKSVNANASATQEEVDAATAALDKAVSTYNSSKDETASSSDSSKSSKSSSSSSTKKSTSKSGKSSSKKGFQVGRVYAVPMSFTKAGTSDTSMANQYFGSTAYVRPLKNGKFDVRFSTNRSDYVTSISYNGSKLSTTSSSGNAAEYKMTVSSTKSDATYRMSLDIKPMRELGGGPAEADLHLRFSQATDKGQDTGQVASPSNNGGSSSDSASSSTRTVGAQSTGDGESFEIGQTYTVPAEFTKAGSAEKSMADQYFEHTAEVKPVDGGKYEVTITTNRSDYITEIKYDGKALSGGAENGKKRSYTMTVPSSKSDAVYTLNMTVKPMQELGGGPADADLHLKYSQAVNKATGRPVSASSTPQTGDSSRFIVVALGCMAVSAGLVLFAGRRQSRA